MRMALVIVIAAGLIIAMGWLFNGFSDEGVPLRAAVRSALAYADPKREAQWIIRARVDSLLFVVDTLNTLPGGKGTITIAEVAFVR